MPGHRVVFLWRLVVPNFASQVVGSLHIVICGAQNPSNEEWMAYDHQFREATRNGASVGDIRTLVFSDGGGPNSAQRKHAADVLRGRSIPVAIVSHSPLMRGVVTALSWFNPRVCAFAPESIAMAMRYLEIPELKHEATLRIARMLQEKSKMPRVRSLELARLSTVTETAVRAG